MVLVAYSMPHMVPLRTGRGTAGMIYAMATNAFAVEGLAMKTTPQILLAVLFALGCGGDGDDGGGGGGTEVFAAERVACVDRINAFRATENLPPLGRWSEAEGCSDEQADLDANGGGPHGNFGMCDERAQNTCPGWPSTDAVVGGCLQAMWDEGPGEPFSEHGHYINMSSTGYTKVACGFYEDSDGVWASQNFR